MDETHGNNRSQNSPGTIDVNQEFNQDLDKSTEKISDHPVEESDQPHPIIPSQILHLHLSDDSNHRPTGFPVPPPAPPYPPPSFLPYQAPFPMIGQQPFFHPYGPFPVVVPQMAYQSTNQWRPPRSPPRVCSAEIASVEEDQEEKKVKEEESGPSTEEIQKERIQNLKELLAELRTHKFATYEKTLPKLMYDSRFTNIPKEDRRSSFATALRLIRDVQQKSDAKDKREAIEALQSYLKKLNKMGKLRSTFTVDEVVRTFPKDAQWMNDLDAKSRDSIVREALEERRRAKIQRHNEDCLLFTELIEEYFNRQEPKLPPPRWSDIKRSLRSDPRYVAVESEERESLFLEVLGKRGLRHTEQSSRRESSRHQRGREFESPRDRPQVDDSRRMTDTHKRPRPPVEESRETQRRRIADQQAKESLRQLLTERIKNPFTMSAREGLQVLERDSRWAEVDRELSEDRKIEIYSGFVDDLKNQRLDLLERELSQTDLISGPNISFVEAVELLGWESDRRFCGLPSAEVELEEAKKSFATYLQTNAAVTPHVPDHGPEFRKLMAQLSDDPRFSRLDSFSEVRDQMVITRIHELQKQRREAPRPTIQ